MKKLAMLLVLCFVLVGCGSGGGSGDFVTSTTTIRLNTGETLPDSDYGVFGYTTVVGGNFLVWGIPFRVISARIPFNVINDEGYELEEGITIIDVGIENNLAWCLVRFED